MIWFFVRIKRLFSAVEVIATGYEVTAANMEVTIAGYVSTVGEDCRKYSKALLLLEETLNKKNHSTHEIYLFQEKMESVSAQVVAAAKLPVLNPSKFELWKMRIKQYFLMTDYALWEVILNGDSPLTIRTIDGVKTSVPPTTLEHKLARKIELKARGTLLMALLNEH
ncbi:hypothetical protein Tco_0191049 [Tanacetum coccineum]